MVRTKKTTESEQSMPSFSISPKEHYEFEVNRRHEINQNLMHVIQFGLAEQASIIYFVSTTKTPSQFGYCFNLVIWASFVFCLLSLVCAIFGLLYYKNANLNSAKELRDYQKSLQEYDTTTAEQQFSQFLQGRWIDNATKNWERNRGKSQWNLWARIFLVVSSIPLVAFVGRFVYEMFPL